MAQFASVSSANEGNVLCSSPTSYYCEGAVQPAGSYFTFGKAPAVEGLMEVTTPSNSIKCDYFLFANKTTAEHSSSIGAPLPAEEETIYSGCGHKAGFEEEEVVESCTASSPVVPSSLSGEFNGTGSVTIGTSTSPWQVTFACTAEGWPTRTCTFKASSPLTVAIKPYKGLTYATHAVMSDASLTLVSAKEYSLPCGTPKLKFDGRVASGNYLAHAIF